MGGWQSDPSLFNPNVTAAFPLLAEVRAEAYVMISQYVAREIHSAAGPDAGGEILVQY